MNALDGVLEWIEDDPRTWVVALDRKDGFSQREIDQLLRAGYSVEQKRTTDPTRIIVFSDKPIQRRQIREHDHAVEQAFERGLNAPRTGRGLGYETGATALNETKP